MELKIPNIYQISNSKVLEKVGPYAQITDFAIITGQMSNNDIDPDYYLCASYWTSSTYDYKKNEKIIIGKYGFPDGEKYNNRKIGVRLIIPYKEKELDNFDILTERNNEIKYIRFGYYPQSVAYNALPPSNKKRYTKEIFAGIENEKITEDKELMYHPNLSYIGNNNIKVYNYKHNSKKFALINKNNNPNLSVPLNLNNKYNKFKKYLVEIEPVEWYIDEDLKILISKKILLSGLSYDKELKDNDFLNNYVLKEMFKYEKRTLSINNSEEEKINMQEHKEFIDIDNKMNDIKKRIRRLQDK